MRRSNPRSSTHARNVEAFLSSAEHELDEAKAAFAVGSIQPGWEHYLEAYREIGRAQQEILHASDGADDDTLDILDRSNERLNALDEMVRRGIQMRLGAQVPFAMLFEQPTATMVRPGLVQVPIGEWKTMRGQLAAEVIRQYGSTRRAAPALGVSRSTLSHWLKEASPTKVKRRSTG